MRQLFEQRPSQALNTKLRNLVKQNIINAAKFDEKLSNFVIAVDCIMFAPLIMIKANTKNEPVPGPKKPS